MAEVDLKTLPERMKDLPVDKRGWPVPWFVDWVNGEPEFRAMDIDKFRRALKEKLCWVCGQRMGVHVTFVAGPMCGINRTSPEPPNHHDCALWSAINCPFLNNPRMVRREDEVINNACLRENSAGLAIARNPGVTMLWNCRQFEVFNVANGTLITMGEPETVEWYANGKPATRAEVQESIDSGLHNLVSMAQTQTGGLESLNLYVSRIQKWLPS